MSRGAVIAALPGELKPWVRGWKCEAHGGVVLWRSPSSMQPLLAACAGAGAQAAGRAFACCEQDGPLDWVASVGWAGALNSKTLAGQAYRITEVVDAATGERLPGTARPLGVPTSAPKIGLSLVSVAAPISDPENKRRLGQVHETDLADMEAVAVARLARVRGIPFYCIKGVSDGHADKLPDFQRFLTPDGHFQTAHFIADALLKPKLWPTLVRLGLHSRHAAKNIALELQTLTAFSR